MGDLLADWIVTSGVTKPDDNPLDIGTPTDIAPCWLGYLIESIELSFWSVVTRTGRPDIDCRFDVSHFRSQTMLMLEGVGMLVSNRSRKVFVVANPEPDIGP
nr:hypothetical protein [Nostoc sp. CreGUA01]